MTHVVVTTGSERWRMAGLLVCAAVATSACQHYQTDVPGTLDLRSDAADAPSETQPLPPEVTRDGLEAWMKGAGVTVGGAGVVVAEDRAVWALRLFPLGDGVADEAQGALGKSGALRALSLQEQISLFDAALVACTLPIPCVDLGTVTMLPTYTVRLTGTRVRPGAGHEPSMRTAPVDDGAPPAVDRPSRASGSTP